VVMVLAVLSCIGTADAQDRSRKGLVSRAPVPVGIPMRVATFNIENFNASPGDPQFEAALAVLARVGADVVCVQEMVSSSSFVQLAEAAGYFYRVLSSPANALDTMRKPGIISVHPITACWVFTSIDLSGDPDARDITRNFIVAEVDVPGVAHDLVLICNHWQSMNDDADEFQRSIESIRAMQVADGYDSRVVPYFIAGDMNDDIVDPPDTPELFFQEPSGLPALFRLGQDIGFPVANGAFLPLQHGMGSQAVTVIDAWQLDGRDATHGSGRRLDYLWHSEAVSVVAAEVYDSEDEGMGGLRKHGEPLAPDVSETASDHLIVFADVLISG